MTLEARLVEVDIKPEDEPVCECGHLQKHHLYREGFCTNSGRTGAVRYCTCKEFKEAT